MEAEFPSKTSMFEWVEGDKGQHVTDGDFPNKFRGKIIERRSSLIRNAGVPDDSHFHMNIYPTLLSALYRNISSDDSYVTYDSSCRACPNLLEEELGKSRE